MRRVSRADDADRVFCARVLSVSCISTLISAFGLSRTRVIGHPCRRPLQRYAAQSAELGSLYKYPGEIKGENGKRQIVIDQRADKAQRVALETIVSGEACEPLSDVFSVFASICSESCRTLFLSIDLEADLEGHTGLCRDANT